MRYNLIVVNSIIALLLFAMFSASAQKRKCATMEVLENKLRETPGMQNRMNDINQFTEQMIQARKRRSNQVDSLQRADIITIPVVVHVIYQSTEQNISDAQVISQIEVLNKDFRRTNSDANNTWPQAADTGIEFCLATIDPDGNASDGINRKFFDRASWGSNDAMKFSSQGGVNAWPVDQYLNIWVCNIGGGILGYAQFPGDEASTDGVVISPQFFGTTGTASPPFNLGRTTTHEVGHWLNLRHIWGDGNCSRDDFISDTPTSDNPNYGCATGHVSCGTVDMVQNYMDYSDDACMNLFTEGQKDRMLALFEPGGFRAGLLNATACNTSQPPAASCTDGIQNQGEGGIDCGGPCPACPTACSNTEVVISITFDNYPEETSWAITNESGQTVAAGGTYANQPDGGNLIIKECLVDGCYDFIISDAYSDGICCNYGNGSYIVSTNGNSLAFGGSFDASETSNFCLGSVTATCNDGIQNQGETGVDCGGPCSACATCNDGLQNQGETGVDCGGPCNACTTCNDGIQNQGETDVDCGGPCNACATCDDGIQNQNETGIDCGGDCAPCIAACTGTEVNINIVFDNYPEETSWEITNTVGEAVASGGNYNNQPDGSSIALTQCLPKGCYNFIINDAYSDGICCGFGNGFYFVSANGSTLASGSSFTNTEVTNFCLEDATVGVLDCDNLINSEDFETGWGIWNDAGADSYRNNYSTYASSGTYTIRLRDNSNSSFTTTNSLDLAAYEKIIVEFTYYPVQLEDSEDFWLQISTDGGTTFKTVQTWVKPDDFQNDQKYTGNSVTIEEDFTSTTQLRFRVDASQENTKS